MKYHYKLPIGKRYIDADYHLHLVMFLKQLGVIDVIYAYETPFGNKHYNVMIKFNNNRSV